MNTAILTNDAIQRKRVASIDILRGLVMLLMLVDHVRERFFYHQQVADPMLLDSTSPELYFTRLVAHLCAPVFVFLTGLSAWLYSHPYNKAPRSATPFLFKRGLFIILVEIAIINWLWMGEYHTLWLQVMWAIGVSMVALSLLCKLPHQLIIALGLLIVCGHNALDPITFAPGEPGYTLWAILHDRGIIYASESFQIKASYPVLPWIGVILLGYGLGPVYARQVEPAARQRTLLLLAGVMLLVLLLLRSFNLYGETVPFVPQENFLLSLMSFLNFTKYPPSLDFLLFNLGLALLLLTLLEKVNNKASQAVETFGSAPMFFYVIHLLILLLGYELVLKLAGPNYGQLFAFDYVWQVWLCSVVLVAVLYLPTLAFARFKQRSSNPLVKYI